MRVDLLVTDRPITPSGTGRAAPLVWFGIPGRRRTPLTVLTTSQTDGPRCSSKLRGRSPKAVDPRRRAQNHHW